MNSSDKKYSFRKERILYLTYIRTSQQNDTSNFRKKLTGKKFSVRPNKPRFCNQNTIVFMTYKEDNLTKVDVKKIGCDSWTCPECNLAKAIRVKYLLRDVITLNNLDKFLTLTLDPKKIPQKYLSHSTNDTHKYITKIFNAFLVSLKREETYKKEKIKYVWVIEFQKNGNAHMHILFNKLPYIPIVRKLWTRVGGGVSMKVIKVKSKIGISNYIGNYIVKGIKGEEDSINTFNFFEKRYSISRSCTRPSSSVIPLLPEFSLQQKYKALQSANLEWVYDALILGEEKTIKL